jgi:hypothetical protein
LEEDISDAAELLSDLFPLSITIKRAFSLNWRTAQQYQYKPTSVDMSVFWGWHHEIGGNDIQATRPLDGFAEILDAHFRNVSRQPYTGLEFIDKYITGHERVPIAVNVDGVLLMDRLTIAWFLIYLNGILELPAESKYRAASIDAYRSRFAVLFEDWIRSEVFGKGFIGPGSPIEKAVDGTRYEYDIIAFSAARNEVRLIEVKSHDLSPSSMTGTNLVRQELTGDDQLLDQARTQQERFDIFLDHKGLFNKHIPVQMRGKQFDVRPFLVTKMQPLISKYCNVEILQSDDFLNSILYT